MKSEENPADFISRGCSPEQLSKTSLWWNDPCCLVQDQSTWVEYCHPIIEAEIPECRNKNNSAQISMLINQMNFNIVDRFSTLTKIQRIVLYL